MGLLTIAQLDARLDACRLAYQDAVDRLDGESADTAYEMLDDLLDQRLRAPHEKPSAIDRLMSPGPGATP